MKVVTVVGTRPEIIKLSRVVAALDKATTHTIIHTGQNYDHELNQIFFEEMGIRKPDHVLSGLRGLSTTASFIGDTMVRLDDKLQQIKSDALLILGDTNSCVAAAYVAKRLKIPVFHMEAGNRCFDERVPEEINRRIVDHISDINLPYSERSRENLIREGIPTDRIIMVGSPMFEVLHYYDIHSDVLARMGLKKKDYFVVSCHREENVDSPENLKKFVDLLNAVVGKYNCRVIVSTHPRTRKRLEQLSETDLYDVAGYQSAIKGVEFYPPFGFFDYNKLQMNARCVLSDSGTISEESSILGFPALNLREAHERPEASEEGAVIMTGFNIGRVMESIPIAQTKMTTPKAYTCPNVSEKVVRTVLSYADYVNKNVWGK